MPRCKWCEEIIDDQRRKYCGDRCRKAFKRSEKPQKPPKRRKHLKGAIRSARKSPSADTNATDLHLVGDGKLVNPGGSGFYNPTYLLAQRMQEAMSPDQNFSRRGEVLEQKEVAERDYDAEEKRIILPYRIVKAKTDKAMLIAMSGKNVWLPRTVFELLPGNRIKVDWGWAVKKRLTVLTEPPEI